MFRQEKYLLYKSLAINIPDEQLDQSKKDELIQFSSNLTLEQKEAFVRIIIENASLKSKDVYSLDYMKSSENNSIEFDITKMPPDLQWILHRFLMVCCRE